MAISITDTNVSPRRFHIDGPTYMTLARITLDGSYSAGGYEITAADIPDISSTGLYGPQGDDNAVARGVTVPAARILAVVPLGMAVSADGLTACPVSWDAATGKLQVFTSAGDGDPLDEAGSADPDGLSVNVLVIANLPI